MTLREEIVNLSENHREAGLYKGYDYWNTVVICREYDNWKESHNDENPTAEDLAKRLMYKTPKEVKKRFTFEDCVNKIETTIKHLKRLGFELK